MAASTPAFAHLDPVAHGSFAAGFSHPLLGLDHVLAMVAVGLWAAMLGGRAMWLVPLSFVGTMLVGFLLAMSGAPLPFVEPVILASVVIMGLFVAASRPVSVWVSAPIVAFFALFHGFAHGGEMGSAGALDYGAGFAAATAALHIVGIGAALIAGRMLRTNSTLMWRSSGLVTAAAGLWLAFVG